MGEILFLAHRVPFPPNRGDKIRSAHLLKKLTKLAPVHIGCFVENEEDVRGSDQVNELAASTCIVRRSKPLVLAGVEAVFSGKPVSLPAFHSHRLANWVRELLANRPISTIFIFSGQMGQYIPESFTGRVVIDLCDVDSAKFESYAKSGERVWLNEREGRLLAREEERLARRADATILISENESCLFQSRMQFPSMAKLHVIGNGIDGSFFNQEAVEPHPAIKSRHGPQFVFTGQMDYAPNVKAALWTASEFMPAIRTRFPDAHFHVVGRSPTKALTALKPEDGVTVWGEVPDVRPFLAAADCVVAPLTIARGVQNKVLEAMAMARPVMLTPEAATGIDAVDGKHWLLCDSDANAMVEGVEPILRDNAQATALGEAARRFVLGQHDWGAVLEPLEQLVVGQSQGARNAA